MNVLLTKTGRNNYLVRGFHDALGGDGRVIVCDTAKCNAFYDADEAFITPPIVSDEYVPFLVDLCRTKEISLVIPLNDLDVLAQARHRELFQETDAFTVVPDERVTLACCDKIEMAKTAEASGIPTPSIASLIRAGNTYSMAQMSFPVVVKPRFGTSTIATYRANHHKELNTALADAELDIGTMQLSVSSFVPNYTDVLVQDLAEGPEYGLDVICDLDCNYQTTIVKMKHAARAGETDSATTVDNAELADLGRKVAEAFPHPGNMDADIIITEEGPVVLDLNPRFGGGYPFSHAAGVDLPAALVAWRKGIPVDESLLTATPGVSAYKDISVQIVPAGYVAPESRK